MLIPTDIPDNTMWISPQVTGRLLQTSSGALADDDGEPVGLAKSIDPADDRCWYQATSGSRPTFNTAVINGSVNVVSFDGIPVKRCDTILNTETAVA